ncbi:hypothetical protein BHE74_00046984 [Ensete ventricosum]|nr:hypothetical protein BHE74_00046984 [Ensete ventricosum]
MRLRWEFARRFAEKIGKLTGNTSGDRRKKIIRLATRMPEAIGLTGKIQSNPNRKHTPRSLSPLHRFHRPCFFWVLPFLLGAPRAREGEGANATEDAPVPISRLAPPPAGGAGLPFLLHLRRRLEAERTITDGPRNNWSRDEIKSIYDCPILDLL